jgi:SAM-dependent methyltransferase
MNPSAQEVIELQAGEHPLAFRDRFETIQDYCLHLMHMRAYEEAARRSKGLHVLDLGCNNGYGTNLIGAAAASVIGCDVSESALADARRRFPAIDFRRIDGISLPIADSQFDLVASFQVIEHIADTGPYLAEISRVLRPGGTALLTTQCSDSPGPRPVRRR